MRCFADKIFSLLWDNPTLADEVFTLSSKQYQGLFELMLNKTSFEKLTIKDFSVLFEKDKPKFIQKVCASLEAILDQDVSLSHRLHAWLNTVIKIHDKAFKKSVKIGLKKNWQEYRYTISTL